MSLKIINPPKIPHFEDFRLLSKNADDKFITFRRNAANSYLKYMEDKNFLSLMKSLKYKVNINPDLKLLSLKDLNLKFKKSNTIVFLNGVFNENLSLYDQKVIEVKEEFQEFNYSKSIFASLSASYLKSPISINIKATPSLPVNVIHINTVTQKDMFFSTIFINISKNTSVNLQETFLSIKEANSLNCRVLVINSDSKSIVNYNQILKTNKSTLCLFNEINLGKNSVLNIKNEIKKSSTIYHDEIINMDTESKLDNSSLFYNFKNYTYNFEISQKSGSHSNIILKSLCDSSEILKINGDLIIPKNQKDVFGYEKFTSLLLGENAKVSFIPNLHIDSEDVNVNHGSAITQLNESEIQYLCSKGIKESQAKKLLIKSFLNQ